MLLSHFLLSHIQKKLHELAEDIYDKSLINFAESPTAAHRIYHTSPFLVENIRQIKSRYRVIYVQDIKGMCVCATGRKGIITWEIGIRSEGIEPSNDRDEMDGHLSSESWRCGSRSLVVLCCCAIMKCFGKLLLGWIAGYYIFLLLTMVYNLIQCYSLTKRFNCTRTVWGYK